MKTKSEKAKIDAQLRKDLKAIDKKIAKVKEKYYDLLDLKVALKAIARLEKNGYKNLTTLEDLIKEAGLENEIAQATKTETKKKLLDTLDNLPLYNTNGIDSKDILSEQRNGKANLEVKTQAKKEALLDFIDTIKPVKSLVSSNEMTQMIRGDKEEELDAKLAVLQQKNH